ncbi:uncharacterized protein LOC141697882 [Apium graveolens]|uniref:uncharacterized protein LOC141697882 n=1 Tax=Apium graveolens TaxID=4045 RepID=UPI003D7BCF4B
MATLANIFALLADSESENVSSIAGLDDTDVKPQENKKKNNKSGRGGGEKGKEGSHGDVKRNMGDNVVEQSYNGYVNGRGNRQGYNGHQNGYVSGRGNLQSYNGHQHNGSSNGYVNGSGNRGYGRVDKPVYKRFWQVKSIVGDGQANGKDGVNVTSHHPDNNRRARVTEIGPDQDFENDEVIASDGGNQNQEAVNSPVAEEVKASHGDTQEHKTCLGDTQEHKAEHGDTQESQGKVSVTTETEVLSKEELRERARLAKEQEEKKAKWHARQEEMKREMAMKTLKEYEEQKAIEKQKKAAKAILSVPQARALDKDLESMQVLSKEKKDDIYTKQKSKNGTTKKDVNIDKDAKVHKTMSNDEFMKLPTETKGDQDGPGSVRSEDSVENTNGGGRGRGVVFRNYNNSNQGGGRGRGRVFRNYENSNQGGGRGRDGVFRNYKNSNQGGTGRRGRSNSRDSEKNENYNRGGIGRGRVYTRNRAPDLSETSIFPVLAEATKPKERSQGTQIIT